jgi:hypothetical protein
MTASAISLPFFVGSCATAGASSASLGSVSSISASSMSSAATEEHHHHYSTDVSAAASSALSAGGSEREILRSVGRVAEHYNISDWEADDATYVAIGEALKTADRNEEEIVALARKLSGGIEQRTNLLLEAYYS